MSMNLIACVCLPSTMSEALEFYEDAFSVLPGQAFVREATAHYPSADVPESWAGMEGKELFALARLRDLELAFINAPGDVSITPAISIMLTFDPADDADAARHLRALWERLLDDGTALMPLDTYDFSPLFGWVRDRFGLTFQLRLASPGAEPRPFAMPALMFTSDEPRAEAAARAYTALIPGSAPGSLVRMPTSDHVLVSDARLGEQWVMLSDSPGMHAFGFTEGVSLMLECDTQEEIDAAWEALAAREFGGSWCEDAFGVRWQVVPTGLVSLIANPAVHREIVSMTKIDLDRLRTV